MIQPGRQFTNQLTSSDITDIYNIAILDDGSYALRGMPQMVLRMQWSDYVQQCIAMKLVWKSLRDGCDDANALSFLSFIPKLKRIESCLFASLKASDRRLGRRLSNY